MYGGLFNKAENLLKLTMVIPATNAASERSVYALCHVKTYPKLTMTQVSCKAFTSSALPQR